MWWDPPHGHVAKRESHSHWGGRPLHAVSVLADSVCSPSVPTIPSAKATKASMVAVMVGLLGDADATVPQLKMRAEASEETQSAQSR